MEIMKQKNEIEKQNKKMHCLHCGKTFRFRTNKKFCDSYCRSTFNYEKSKRDPSDFIRIKSQLIHNRKLLRYYNKDGLTKIACSKLIEKGFNPHYFTHYWKNNKGETYLFCFENGYLKKSSSKKSYYILIKWQKYMKASIGV